MEGSSFDFVFKKMMHPDVFKLDCFDETNFTHWKDKLLFLLTELGIAYLLLRNLPLILEPSNNDTENVVATRKKLLEDEIHYRGFIFNSLFGQLYDLFHSIQSPKRNLIST